MEVGIVVVWTPGVLTRRWKGRLFAAASNEVMTPVTNLDALKTDLAVKLEPKTPGDRSAIDTPPRGQQRGREVSEQQKRSRVTTKCAGVVTPSTRSGAMAGVTWESSTTSASTVPNVAK